MPLLDHFRPPLSVRRHWHSFLHAWATCIASDLNTRLPEGYFAEPNVQFGIEIDVAALDELPDLNGRPIGGWTPPESPALVTDTVEVSIFADEGGPVLAGAIELVSPANKDRPAHRAAFTSKCASYLQAGVGLVVVNIVTDRGVDLHTELIARLSDPGAWSVGDLYSAAYRLVGSEGEARLEIWHEPIALGGTLPVMPLCLKDAPCLPVDPTQAVYEQFGLGELCLKGGPCLPVDLGVTYDQTRRGLRMADGA